MRNTISLLGLLLLITQTAATADDAAARARVKAQVEALAKQKQAAAAANNKQDDKQVTRDHQAVDAKTAAAKQKIDHANDSFQWIYGPEDSTKYAGKLKNQVDAAANEQKAKIAADAARRAAARNAAADKQVKNLVDSAHGLKSQIPTKKGEFGLQPAGTNLNVRNYGTAK